MTRPRSDFTGAELELLETVERPSGGEAAKRLSEQTGQENENGQASK